MKVSAEVKATLGVSDVAAFLGRRARSELALHALESMAPSSDFETLCNRQELLRSCRDYESRRGDLPWHPSLRLSAWLLEEAKATGWLDGESLLQLRLILTTAMNLRSLASSLRKDWSPLSAFFDRLRDFSNELADLSVLDDKGQLEDRASPQLAELRRELEDLRSQSRKVGNQFLSGSDAHMLQEKVLSTRNGRYTLLVRQPFIHRFPGIVTDRSASGNSLYMEPHSLVSLNNRIAALLEEIRNEERRILTILTGQLVKRQGAVNDAEQTLCHIDFMHCASEWMSTGAWQLPKLKDAAEFSLKNAVHPLIGPKAVPNDIACGRNYRQLIVTGPNTGGKTVALKTAALCIYLAWCGFPIPADESSQVGNFDAIFADIGDEQSIEQSLSTFSSHLKRIVQALEEATAQSLILLDELGAGTDPQEGAALGMAILDEFLRRRSLVLATTHHNAIKHFATTTAGVETACVDFNKETLSPTYRLLTGVPGQSNALAIARRYGMPRSIVQTAQSFLNEQEVDAERLIGQLQQKTVLMEEREQQLTEERRILKQELGAFEKKRASLERQKDDVLLKAEREAQKVLDEAEAHARDLLRSMTEAAESAGHRAMDRHKKETSSIRERSSVRTASLEARHKPAVKTKPLAPGDTVRLTSSKGTGEILSISGKKAEVQVGSMRITVALNQLERTKAVSAPLRDQLPSIKAPVGVPSSIMVRGMTLDEALPMVENYLDRALRAGYGEVTVIHGRGEGILRREIHALCARLRYVSEYRLGDIGEGGYGVTIVSFR